MEIRLPRDAAERDVMWRGRKSAFAASGASAELRRADGVIPRSEIAKSCARSSASAGFGVRIANVFQPATASAPLVLYDPAVPGAEERAERAGGEILKICVRAGGSITGEHGVGADKAPYMADQFSDADLATMNLVRCASTPSADEPGQGVRRRAVRDRPGKYVAPDGDGGLAGRG